MINWNVRLRNKGFVLALVSALIVAVQMVFKMLGFHLNLNGFSANVIDVINSIFVVLTILGVVTDPTTQGISDSEQALTYDKPRKGEEQRFPGDK